MLSGDDVFKVVWIVTEKFGLSAILATIPGARAPNLANQPLDEITLAAL